MALKDRISIVPGFLPTKFVMTDRSGNVVASIQRFNDEDARISRDPGNAATHVWVTGRATLQLMKRRNELFEVLVELERDRSSKATPELK